MSENRVKTEGLAIIEHTAKNNDYNALLAKGEKSADLDKEIMWVSPYERLQHWVSADEVVSFRNGQFQCNSKKLNERLRLSNQEKDKLIKLVRFHQFTVSENQTDSAVRRFITNVGLPYIEDMLELRRADRLGSGSTETSWRLEDFKKRILEVQKQPFSIKDLKINGKDVMDILKISSGPKVGEVLEKIFKDVVENKLENERETLIKAVK